jgi:hypothetical protein
MCAANRAGEDTDMGILVHEAGTELAEFYRTLSLDEVFARYRAVQPDAAVHGNVHSYTLNTLLERIGSADLGGLSVANVVRHPVTFIESHTALVRGAEKYPHLYTRYVSELFFQTLREYPELFLVDCPDVPEFLAFAGSCRSALNVGRGLAREHFPHFRMESLTSEVDALETFCRTVSGIHYARDRLVALIEQGAVNRHRRTTAPIDPDEIYAAWPLWKQDIAAVTLTATDLGSFERVGYDIAVLCRRHHRARSDNVPKCLADAIRAYDSDHPLLALLKGAPADATNVHGSGESPRLLRSIGGFNIVQFRGRFYGVPQGLGPLDLEAIVVEEYPDIIVGDDEGVVLERIADCPAGPPVVEGAYRGYNLIRLGGTMIAAKQSLGPIDFANPLEQLKAALGADDFIIDGDANRLRQCIDVVLDRKS